MRVLLTGITGNLGSETSFALSNLGISIIPIVRSKKAFNLDTRFSEVIENDLLSKKEIGFAGKADCILHCAGDINFHSSSNSNQKMVAKLIKLAKNLEIPIYFVSTAYIYRPPGINQSFNNSYELDKYKCEQLLISSGLKYGIFRPAVLVGNSETGMIRNFSGYYNIVRAFYLAITNSIRKGKKLRFPKIPGTSNLVPVDQAANCIANEIEKLRFETWYITNPNPPEASWVLDETLDFFNFTDNIELIDYDFEKFVKLELTDEENNLYKLIKHYYPYWSIDYDFPTTVCKKNLITPEYLQTTLAVLKSSNFLGHG